jgi:hypothetical protein
MMVFLHHWEDRMAIQLRVVVLSIALLLLTGCMGTFGSFEPQTLPVTESTIVLPVRFLDGDKIGPEYQVSLTVPEEWVGQFVTNNNGNVVNLDFTETPGGQAPIFSISALSERQYWEQVGGYPGTYRNVLSTGDTFFVYHLPRDAYHSGLDAETYTAFAEEVPGIMTTFAVQLAQ